MSIKSIIQALVFLPVALGASAQSALNPACAPGGNFNLGIWDLQLPIGSTDDPTIIPNSELVGCDGYTNTDDFYTESTDGALVMKVCGSTTSCGCVTTSGSLHCRTEFRETSPSSWDPTTPLNRLTVELVVIAADNGTHGTVIGQVFNSAADKPVGELFFSQAGIISIGVEQTAAGGDEIVTDLGTIPVGQIFTYQIAYEGGVLSVAINGGAAQVLSTYSLDNPLSYFKAGNYNQGGVPSEVHFYSITVEHSTSNSTSTASSTPTTTSSSGSSGSSSSSRSSTTTATTTSSTTSSAPTTTSSSSSGVAKEYGQCGGKGWTGPTICASPYTCQYSNAYYSQCL